MDCQDDSDEHLCGLIKLNPDKYRKAYMPNSPSVNDTLLIEVDFGVKDIVDINEPGVCSVCIFRLSIVLIHFGTFFHRCFSL